MRNRQVSLRVTIIEIGHFYPVFSDIRIVTICMLLFTEGILSGRWSFAFRLRQHRFVLAWWVNEKYFLHIFDFHLVRMDIQSYLSRKVYGDILINQWGSEVRIERYSQIISDFEQTSPKYFSICKVPFLTFHQQETLV